MAKNAIKVKGIDVPAIVLPDKVNDEKASGTLIRGMIKEGVAKEVDLRKHHAITAAKIVVHALRYGDVSLATEHVNSFGEKGKTFIRSNLLRQWYETYGPFRFDSETKGFKKHKEKFDAMQPRIESDKATAKLYTELVDGFKPWEEQKPEAEYKGISAEDELDRLIKSIEARIKKHPDDPKNNVFGLDHIRNARAMIAAERAGVLAKVKEAAAA